MKHKRHPLISWLLTTRLTRGISQNTVAERGKLSRSAVVALESGHRNPSLASFVAYCDGLGYDIHLTPKRINENE